MEQIDRRRFIQRTGLGAGAAGALWIAPSVMGFDAAFAGVSCVVPGTITWSSYTGIPPTVFTFPAVGSIPALTVTRTLTVGSGITPDPNTNGRVNVQTLTTPPDTAGSTIGGQSSWFNMQFRTTRNNSGETLAFGFTVPVVNLKFTLLDIDADPGFFGYTDALWVTTTPATPAFTFTQVSAEVSGTGTSQGTAWTGSALVDNTVSDSGNVTVTIPGPVSNVVIHYNGTRDSLDSQVVGVSDLTWCR